VSDQPQTAELRWVLRPAVSRPADLRALTGQPVHGTGATGPDGQADVTLSDGTRVRVTPAEISAE
jgi:hypothetical protein